MPPKAFPDILSPGITEHRVVEKVLNIGRLFCLSIVFPLERGLGKVDVELQGFGLKYCYSPPCPQLNQTCGVTLFLLWESVHRSSHTMSRTAGLYYIFNLISNTLKLLFIIQ